MAGSRQVDSGGNGEKRWNKVQTKCRQYGDKVDIKGFLVTQVRHVGDLGNIDVDETGVADIKIEDHMAKMG